MPKGIRLSLTLIKRAPIRERAPLSNSIIHLGKRVLKDRTAQNPTSTRKEEKERTEKSTKAALIIIRGHKNAGRVSLNGIVISINTEK
jgi:hypothetical protein